MLWERRPLQGKALQELIKFLNKMELQYDENIEYTVCVFNDDYEMIGTGSVDQNVIKCVAIAPDYRGQGLAATIISDLVQYEFERGRTHLFIYTKPGNRMMFEDLGFYTILETQSVLFMENRSRGFEEFVGAIRQQTPEEALEGKCVAGAVVANCNPFTRGHQYLIEQALMQCDYLHLFLLSDNRSCFSAEERFEMARQGTAKMSRVLLHRTQDYMISAATFPTYFFKDQAHGRKANCKLDLELFAAKIAPELHITKRFVGNEPHCLVTREYNEEMRKLLPPHGIEVVEIERKSIGGIPISASDVRKHMENGMFDKIRELVPENVYRYLSQEDDDV